MYGERLKQIRIKRKLTQFEVQKLTGIDPSLLSKWENGKKEMQLNSFVRLIKAYKVDPKKVIYDYDDNARCKDL